VQLSLIRPGPIESDFRINAYKAFNKHIDKQNSDYRVNYEKMVVRLQSKKTQIIWLGKLHGNEFLRALHLTHVYNILAPLLQAE
jgi:hypothetical protein